MVVEIKHIVAEFPDTQELQQEAVKELQQEAVKIEELYHQMVEKHKEDNNKRIIIMNQQGDEIAELTQENNELKQKLENLEEIFHQELDEFASTLKKHDQDMEQVLHDLRRKPPTYKQVLHDLRRKNPI